MRYNNQILTNAVAGEYRLTVTNAIGASNFATVTIPRTVTKPTTPLISNIQTQSATVSWTGDAETYQLQYKPSAQANWITATNISANTAILSNLSVNTRYDVRVIARCVDTNSEPSPVASFITSTLSNRQPEVKIVDPTNNSIHKAPASLSIQVEATDPDGTIAKVEFYINDRLIGSDFEVPYTRNITLNEGIYNLTAKAIDNLQAFTISSPVSITVNKAGHEFDEPCGKILALSTTCNFIDFNNTGASPSAGINSVCPGSSTGKDIWFQFVAPSSGRVTIETRSGTLIDGVMALYLKKNSCIDLQELNCQDDPVSGGLMPSLEAKLTPGQTYLIRFWGYDGAEGSFQLCARIIAVNQTPSVFITSPSNNSSFNTPASFLFEADAYDPDGSISKVEFFLNGNLRGADSQAPYSSALSNLEAGSYILTAKAYDNQGAVTTSNAHTINVINNTNPDDEPCGKVLSVSADLNYIDATNSRATFSSSVSTTGLCSADGVIKDVWFQFTVSSTRPVVIQALAGTLSDGVMALYRRQGTCTQLQLITCNDDEGEGNMPRIQLNNPVVGQVYLIRFWGYNSTEGTFRLGIQQDDFLCPAIVDPVCGSDGKEYPNACYAERAGVSWWQGSCTTNNRNPEVSITAPANNASYNAPASFSVTTSATDPDGSISKVEFFLNGNLHSTDSQFPYTSTLTIMVPGNYTLTAKAYDNQQASTISDAISIRVNGTTNPPLTTSNNNALVLNGVSDFKSVGSRMFDDIRSFTIETWARFNAPSSGNNDFIAEIGNSSYTKIWFWYNNDNTFGLPSRNIAIGYNGAQGGYNGGPDFLYSFTPQAGTWHHLAYTFDFVSKRITLYIDGLSQGSRTVSGASPSISQLGMNLNIGRRIFGGVNNHFFNGQLDEFRVWDYARTAGEIAQNYQTELSGSESGLICYYKFDDAVDSDCSSRRLNLQGSARTPQNSSVPNLRDVGCGSRLKDLGSELSNVKISVSIYPNPTSGLSNVMVKSDQGVPQEWLITDIYGRILKQIRRDPEANKVDYFDIDFSEFSNGIYLLSANKGGKVLVYRVSIVN